ncbi:MAG: hypothetical protein IJ557_02455 [Bacteroidaceae bacterium]|nr:hypothetical protein [Bacteroidaceae bacterium]
MYWVDVALITFSCVAANHLGLVAAIEGAAGHSIPIANCPKCLCFWANICYGLFADQPILLVLSTAFLSAYLASWMELGMAYIDKQFTRIYETLYTPADTSKSSATTSNLADPDSTLPDLPENKK